MTSRVVVLWITAIAVSFTALAWSGATALDANRRVATARESLATLLGQVGELSRLRASAPRDEERPSAPEDLPRQVSRVMRSCGLQAATLGSFDAGTATRENDGLTQRASLVLQQVTLPQVGRFLSEWRRAEPHWKVASIEISPRGEPPAAGGDLPLQAVVTLESSRRAPEARP